jgi:hypothetical protein
MEYMCAARLTLRIPMLLAKLTRRLDDALAEGPKSILWSQLRHSIPAATFSRFANLAGVQEKCDGNRKARLLA